MSAIRHLSPEAGAVGSDVLDRLKRAGVIDRRQEAKSRDPADTE